MQQDHLSRQSFIDLLKNIIANQSADSKGYSIAIDGEWGSGKTWVLTELEQQLSQAENNKYLIFHYNVWENDYYEEPLVAILSILISSLQDLKTLNEKNGNTKIISKSITTLLKLAGSVVEKKWGINPSEIFESTKDLTVAISDKKLTKEDFNSLLPLENTLKVIKEVLSDISKKYKIILIVDELDRCLPEYSIKVLERLHHVCNEMPVFQIIAIDKKQLADGISKVYGKVHINKSGNIEKHILQFADSYLQKFIDVSIPLSNGVNKTDLSILKGLEDFFEPYIRKNMVGQELVVFDDKFLLDFIKTLFDGIDKRTMEKVLSLVKTCHELTLASGATMEYYMYPHLVYEVIFCIQVYCFHQKSDLKIKKFNDGRTDAYKLIFFNELSFEDNPYYKKYHLFNSNLAQITKCYLSGTESEYGFDFEVTNTISYFMKFFAPRRIRFMDPLQNGFNEWISEDMIFLDKYKSILLQLVL